MSRLCGDCRDRIHDWQDTKPSVLLAGGIRLGGGGAYDDTASGMRANRERRWRDWRDLVNFQERLIRDICTTEQHVAPDGGSE